MITLLEPVGEPPEHSNREGVKPFPEEWLPYVCIHNVWLHNWKGEPVYCHDCGSKTERTLYPLPTRPVEPETAVSNDEARNAEIDAAIDALFPGAVLVPRNAAFRALGIQKSYGHLLMDAGVLERVKLGNASRITVTSIKRVAHGLPRR